jgi:hypothetical protein
VPDDEQRCGKKDEVVSSLMDRGRPACKPWVLAITMLLMLLSMPLLVTSVNATCMPGMRTPGSKYCTTYLLTWKTRKIQEFQTSGNFEIIQGKTQGILKLFSEFSFSS